MSDSGVWDRAKEERMGVAQPDRVQVMPDGARMPIPSNSPRFEFDAYTRDATPEWHWQCGDGEFVPIATLRDANPLEWDSCCAGAACAFRRAEAMHYDQKCECADADACSENALDAQIAAETWDAALAKAEKGTR